MKKYLSILFCMALGFPAIAQDKVNTDFFYFLNGETPGYWGWVIRGDGNWWMPIEDSGGQSAGGALKIEKADDAEIPSAMKLKWRKGKGEINASIVGSPVDLSKYENAAEYAIALKVISRKVPKKVFFKVNCGKDCSGQVDISDSLKKAPRKKWFVLPVPLNCLAMQGVDLSNIDWPLSLATAGSLEIHLAEVRIAPMKKGSQGCAAEPEDTE